MIFENEDLLIRNLGPKEPLDYEKIGTRDRRIFAYRKDRLVIKLKVYNKKDKLIRVKLRAHDFLSEDARIVCKNVRINTLSSTLGHIGRAYGPEDRLDFPKIKALDIIDKGASLKISGKSSAYFYLYIDLGESKAGFYEGPMELMAGGARFSFNLGFEILDIERKPIGFDLNLWQYPYSQARYFGISNEDLFKESHQQALRNLLDLYRSYQGKTLTVSIVDEPWNHQVYDPYPSMVRVDLAKDLALDFSHFDAYVDLGGEDFSKIYAFSIISWDKDHLDKTYWDKFLRAFIDHLDQKGIFDRVYIGLDERSESLVKDSLDFLSLYKNKEGKSLKIAYQTYFSKENISLYDRIDDLSFGLDSLDGDLMAYLAKRKARGLYTSLYTSTGVFPNSFIYSSPIESTYIILLAYLRGFDGFLRWALDAWVKEPRKDLSFYYFESADTLLAYPGKEDLTIASSVRLEAMGEGLRMAEKIGFLKENLASKTYKEFVSQLPSFGLLESFTNPYGARVGKKQSLALIEEKVLRLRDLIYTYSKKYVEERDGYNK
ncbi:MAG: DUF4091 domain-containing protein [Anaerococcus sp.]|nr:DUF4091 domain-containing protein [Anaerococcus sp.]